MPPKAAAVALKLGKVKLTGIRPPSSQSARMPRIEAARSSEERAAGEMPRHAVGVLAAPEAGAARPLPVTLPDADPRCSGSARCPHGFERLLQRSEVPEVLDVQRGRVTLHLTDQAVELEIGLSCLLAATVAGEQALLGTFLEVRHDLLHELGLEVLGQAQAIAFLDHEVRVFED